MKLHSHPLRQCNELAVNRAIQPQPILQTYRGLWMGWMAQLLTGRTTLVVQPRGRATILQWVLVLPLLCQAPLPPVAPQQLPPHPESRDMAVVVVQPHPGVEQKLAASWLGFLMTFQTRRGVESAKLWRFETLYKRRTVAQGRLPSRCLLMAHVLVARARMTMLSCLTSVPSRADLLGLNGARGLEAGLVYSWRCVCWAWCGELGGFFVICATIGGFSANDLPDHPATTSPELRLWRLPLASDPPRDATGDHALVVRRRGYRARRMATTPSSFVCHRHSRHQRR